MQQLPASKSNRHHHVMFDNELETNGTAHPLGKRVPIDPKKQYHQHLETLEIPHIALTRQQVKISHYMDTVETSTSECNVASFFLRGQPICAGPAADPHVGVQRLD